MENSNTNTNDAPVSAKKPLIDNMLALEQKSTFVPEKAAELFVDGHRASIVVSYWNIYLFNHCWVATIGFYTSQFFDNPYT